MFGQSLLSAFGSAVACTTDTVQILNGTPLESIATYQLNNATTSIPSNTYPGTVTGTVTYPAGVFGDCIKLTGNTTWVTLNNIPYSLFNAQDVSVSLWVNMQSLANGYADNSYVFAGNGDFKLQVTNGTYSDIIFQKYNSSFPPFSFVNIF